MDRLYLLRHGTAVPHGSPDYPEDERPLTAEGEKQVRRVARGLRRLKIKLDRIATSPLPRALKTAEIAADVLGMTDLLEIVDDLRAGARAQTIKEWIDSRPESRLLVVGHNPAITDVIGLLITGEPGPPLCELKTAGVAALRNEGGSYQLDWLTRPRVIRRLSR